MRIAALAGGVGAAKFLAGLVQEIPPEDLTVVVNTGDDFEWHGLTVCPDLDTVVYTLGGVANPSTGWGLRGDTFQALDRLEELGSDSWFRIGDRDLATHVYRTNRLRCGSSLSDVARALAAGSGVATAILPMSDAPVRTRVHTDEGTLDFQDYFVRRGCAPRVSGFTYEGSERAAPAAGVLEAIDQASVVVVCPSNPFISIGPILAVRGVRQALRSTAAQVVAISPIVAGKALKGPADQMLRDAGLEVSATSIARMYGDFADGFVLDRRDAALVPDIERLGMNVRAVETVMDSPATAARLARAVLEMLP
jgi:LPPG:FO 2-phospho-L-lactate transferase